MYRDIELTPKEEKEIIRKAADLVHKYGMETAAIMTLETVKPLVYIGGQMGRFFLMPFLPFFGENIGVGGEKFFTVFEQRKNIEELIKLLEKKTEEEELEKQRKAERKPEEESGSKRKGWRRFLPL